MAPGKSSRPPIEDPYFVDYAPTGRAICKKCERLLTEGTVRFCQKVWSPFHDGFDIKYSHFVCGVAKLEELEELKGWQALRWVDVLRVAKRFNKTIDESDSRVKEQKNLSDMIWALKDNMMEQLNLKALKPILDANRRLYVEKKLKLHQAAHVVADGILLGKLPPCPLCECEALVQGGPEYKCNGWISGATKCTFSYTVFYLTDPDALIDNSASGVTTEHLDRVGLFALPDIAKAMPFFVKWKPPVDATGIKRFGNPMKMSAAGDGRKATVKKESLDSDHEPDSDVPKMQELVGMEFAACGTITPARKDMIPLVEKHGGKFTETIERHTDFLLVGDDIAVKEQKKFQDAISMGVPVLHCSFVPALVSRNSKEPSGPTAKGTRKTHYKWGHELTEEEAEALPKGLLLRCRKYMVFYRIQGKLLKSFGNVKALLDAKAKAQREGTHEGGKKTTMRPKIIPGSALLEVDADVKKKNAKIYVDSLRNAYNCSLHKTDLAIGQNKFYIIQLLQVSSGRKSYSVLRKWGRLGAENKMGNGHLIDDFHEDLEGAVDAFEKRYKSFTLTEWDDRLEFKQVPDGYAYVEIHGYMHDGEGVEEEDIGGAKRKKEERGGSDGEENADEQQPKITKRAKKHESKKNVKKEKGESKADLLKKEASKLDERIQAFIEMIFDRDMMIQQLEEQNLDLQKLPLQSISSRQLKEGYSILQELQTLLQETAMVEGTVAAVRRNHKLLDATTRFYTQVPHVFSRSAVPPIIDSLVKLRGKVDMMEQLLDVSVANRLLEEVHADAKENVCQLDLEYDKLHCGFVPIEQDAVEWDMIKTMVRDTHASSHNCYSLNIEHIFKCDTHGARSGGVAQTFSSDIGNRALLWHGSRLTNWVGILSKGLRIAPPEAPSTGYMFGKGLYFADVVSKSANYCLATPSDPRGVLILCEVALGKQGMMLEADEQADKIIKEKGFDSTWGVGKAHPNPKDDKQLVSEEDGQQIRVPTGKLTKNKENMEAAVRAVEEGGVEGGVEGSLLYNEYIVYRTEQVRIRFVVTVNFEFVDFNIDD
eukprot:GHVS01067353.1.p1 GENE.GHVS01067353.1~~GHVS01067353.1.p1  ORF type:complete len:1047 (+),score=168.20 GHVS01067353.1:315-3455(+)